MNTFVKRALAWTALAVTAALLSACGGGGSGGTGDSGLGTLSVSLTDAPACGYDAVYVTVSKVRVHQSADASDGAGGWSEIALSPAKKINLLDLANGVLYELGQTMLPAGTYQQIRLVLADNASAPGANSVVPTGGSPIDLDTPSAQQSGLKLKTHFVVPDGQTVDVVLDFDACRSIVPRGNSGRYNLKPVIAAVPVVAVGAISGYAAPGGEVKVSAQIGGVVLKETSAAGDGAFKLGPIGTGTYDVVFTAAGHTTRVLTGVPATVAGDTVLSTSGAPITLPLAASAAGTGAGTVKPAAAAAASASVRALQSIGSRNVEVAWTHADPGPGATAGNYSMILPTTPIEVASWSAPPPPPAPLPTYTFVAVGGTGGKYGLEAAAPGYLTSVPMPVTLAPNGTVNGLDFTLVAVP